MTPHPTPNGIPSTSAKSHSNITLKHTCKSLKLLGLILFLARILCHFSLGESRVCKDETKGKVDPMRLNLSMILTICVLLQELTPAISLFTLYVELIAP